MISIRVAGQECNDRVEGVTIEGTNLWSGPRVNINESDLGQDHGAASAASFLKAKPVRIEGNIVGNSRLEFEQKIDSIKAAAYLGLIPIEVDFPIHNRTWMGRLTRCDMPRTSVPDYLEFVIEIVCLNPIGVGGSASFDVNGSFAIKSDGSTSDTLSNALFHTRGVGDERPSFFIRPVFTLSCRLRHTSVEPDLVNQRVSIGNSVSGHYIELNAEPLLSGKEVNASGIPWSAAGTNELVINCATGIVTMGGVVIDYDGIVPVWRDADRLSLHFRTRGGGSEVFELSGTYASLFNYEYL